MGAVHLPLSLIIVRRSAPLLALLLALIILAPIVPVVSLPLPSPEQPLARQLPTSPTSSDLLVVQIATPAQTQQQQLLLTWTQADQHRHALPLTVLADGRTHRLTLPVGAHPGWHGEIRNLRLVIPHQEGEVQVEQIEIVRRWPLALDLWLLRGLYPILPILPPYANVRLFLVAMLGAGVALTLPWSHWRRRFVLFGLLLAIGVGAWTIVAQLGVLYAVTAAYGTMSDAQAVTNAAAYEADPQAITQLVATVDRLPDGPVLLLDVSPTSDLLHRARYLLYPRRVDVRSPQDAPAEIPWLLAKHYAVAIQLTPTAQPPASGWTRLTTSTGPLAFWQAPAVPPAPPRPSATWPTAVPALLAGLVLITIVGWTAAGALGWRGLLQLGAAWPLGAALLGWWMWFLDVVGLPWSAWSIGVPLLIGAGAMGWSTWQRKGSRGFTWPSLPSWASWTLISWTLIALLASCVLVQAMVMPLTDQDSWTMWGLKGQAFFLDGSIAPVLTTYRGDDVHHASYPPAQPLAQTWLYLMMGGISERLAKVIFPLWYLASILLVWAACRRWVSQRAALGWALLLATTPLMLDHATLGNADLPLAVALLLGGIGLAQWLETSERAALVGASIVFGAAAWLKLDGLYLGAGMLLAALLVRGISSWRDPRQRRPLLGHGLLAGGLFAALVVPWVVYTQLLRLNDIPALDTFQRDGWALLREGSVVLSAEVLFSYNNSSLGLLGGGYGVFWFVCLGALIVGWRRLQSDPVLWFLLLAVAGGFAFYLAVYTLRPYYSVERYLLHIAPLALLAAARASQGALALLPLTPKASLQPSMAAPSRGRHAQAPRARKGRQV